MYPVRRDRYVHLKRFVFNRMNSDMVFWELAIYMVFIEFSLWYEKQQNDKSRGC